MEWPPLGLDGREVAVRYAIRQLRLKLGDDATVQRPIH